VAYWRDVFLPEFYDKHLPRLNSLPQFKVQIDVRPWPHSNPQSVLGLDRLTHLSLPYFCGGLLFPFLDSKGRELPQFTIRVCVRSHVRPYPQRVLGLDRLPHLPLLNSLPQFTVRAHVRAALAACRTSRCSTHFSRTPLVLTTSFVTKAIKWCGVSGL
jgi:hypothetical protein